MSLKLSDEQFKKEVDYAKRKMSELEFLKLLNETEDINKIGELIDKRITDLKKGVENE